MSRARQPWPERLLLLAVSLVGGVSLAGCVTMGRGGLYPLERDQVFVAYFANETFYRNAEFELSEQVVTEILSSPGLRLSSKAEAEVHLEGRVLAVQQAVLAESPTQAPLSTNTSITVEVSLFEARTRKLLRREVLSHSGQFLPAAGEDLQVARRETYRYLARDIVRLLEKDF